MKAPYFLSFLLLLAPLAAGLAVSPFDVHSCPYSTSIHEILVGNTGAAERTAKIELSGEAAAWATVPTKSVKVLPNQVESAPMFITVPGDAELGAYPIKVTDGKEEFYVTLHVDNCHAITVTPEKRYITLCPSQTQRVKLEVQNTGKYTEVVSFTSTSEVEPLALSVEPSSTSKAEIVLEAPATPTEFEVPITARSESGASGTTNLEVSVLDCYHAELQLPTAFEVCQRDQTRLEARLKNVGLLEGDFKMLIYSDFAYLLKEDATLKTDEDIVIPILFDPRHKDVGSYDVKVWAVSDNTETTFDLKVSVRDCWDFSLSAQNFQVCPGKSADVPIRIANLGTHTAAFHTLVRDTRAGPSEYSPAIDGSGYYDIPYTVSAPIEEEPGEYRIEVYSSNGMNERREDIDFTVRGFDQCYSLDLKADKAGVEVGKGAGAGETIKVTITNDGLTGDSYALSASEGWVKVVPEEVFLKPGGSKDIFVYPAPDMATQLGDYTVVLSAKGDYFISYLQIPVKVVEPQPEKKGPGGFVILKGEPGKASPIFGAMALLGIIVASALTYFIHVKPE